MHFQNHTNSPMFLKKFPLPLAGEGWEGGLLHYFSEYYSYCQPPFPDGERGFLIVVWYDCFLAGRAAQHMGKAAFEQMMTRPS